MQLKIQVGVEVYKGGVRGARLTPIDRKLDDMSDELEGLLLLIAGAADANDSQPGDGEVDLPIGTVNKAINNPALKFAESFLKGFAGDANVFVRLTAV